MNEVLFSEKQYFRQYWIWIALMALNLFTLYVTWSQLYRGVPVGNNPVSDKELLFYILLMFMINLLFAMMRLETTINREGIHYRFLPFINRMRTIRWDEISEAEVRKYNPLIEYGGWGIRIGLFGKGGALNVSGNMGLQIILKNGRRLLIGTQKPEDLNKAIAAYA